MFLIEDFEVHTELNPKLWDKETLKEDVREKLLEIIDQFKSTLDIPLYLADAHIVGSQASYNYTEHSDLDLHLITNFDLYDASKEILQIAFNSLKTKFNSDYDIKFRGIDVEIYVEDIKSTTMSNGIYSVIKNEWIKFPEPLTDIPQVSIDTELENLKSKITRVLFSNNPSEIESMINDLYLIRKNGLDIGGEYSKGNLLFKEVRNLGLLDELKDAYKASKAKELSLEHFVLHEDSRNKLLAKSKQSAKGFERFKKRVKSRVANSVKQYNAIDMNKLFKDDILTVDINVKGETDNYIVKISFGGLLELIRDQIEKQGGKFDYKAVTRALILGFNKDDVYIHCSCPDWQYRYSYYATKNNITSGDPETRPSDITNPEDKLGSACKHVLLVLSNTSWLLKVSSTIVNYVRYMEKHYQKLYADIIYPAIYGHDYEEPVQLDIFDDNTLETDSETIDKSNEFARTKNQFQKGNTQGVRFAPKESDQVSIDASMKTGSETGENKLEV